MRLIVSAGLLIPLAAAVAHAQTTQPSAGGLPEKIPFDIPYGEPVDLGAAKKLVAAAEAEAVKRGWKMNIAVVDTHGDLVAFEHMDDAQYASIDVSIRKARTAARFRRETRSFYNQYETGHPYVATLDPQMIVASPGGIPLVSKGKLIGAIGCSGGTGDQDAAVCGAATRANE